MATGTMESGQLDLLAVAHATAKVPVYTYHPGAGAGEFFGAIEAAHSAITLKPCTSLEEVHTHCASAPVAVVVLPWLPDIVDFCQRLGERIQIIVWDRSREAKVAEVNQLLNNGSASIVMEHRHLAEALRRRVRAAREGPEDEELLLALSEQSHMIGKSAPWLAILKQIAAVSRCDVPVLITGESGTGKELAARAIYRQQSCERSSPGKFLGINCANMHGDLVRSELFGHVKGAYTGAADDHIGFFGSAEQGVVFLDEIQALDPRVQAQLLRVLQERCFTPVGSTEEIQIRDVRVIAATNEPLEELVTSGRFRADLYYRLGVVHIIMPPLRERPEDIRLLADHFLRKHAARFQSGLDDMAPEVLRLFESLPWPGNARELENVIINAIIQSRGDRVILFEDIPAEFRKGVVGQAKSPGDNYRLVIPQLCSLEEAQVAMERQYLPAVLRYTKGNQSQAARILKISRSSLRNKLRTHKISIEAVVSNG